MIESSVKANLNSVLVVVLSDVYATIRTAETKLKTNGAGNEAAVWEAPSSFQRTTTKYWVKEGELTKLMLTCAAEAPLLVYGKSGTLTQNRSSGYSEGDKLWESMTTPITSVYFDAPDMSMYKKRLARLEGAQLLLHALVKAIHSYSAPMYYYSTTVSIASSKDFHHTTLPARSGVETSAPAASGDRQACTSAPLERHRQTMGDLDSASLAPHTSP